MSLQVTEQPQNVPNAPTFPVLIREKTADDRNYILATLSKGLLLEAPYRWMVKPVWRKHHAQLEALIDRASVLVACNPEEPSHIFGYLISEEDPVGPIVHYVYVKDLYRCTGIARRLLAHGVPSLGKKKVHFTHKTKIMTERTCKKYNAVYDPYLLLDK